MDIRIATRGSQLALWQAEHVKAKLLEVDPTLNITLNIIKTKGDIILDVSLAKIGGKGLFVKEIEEAMLANEADIAVHSMKDVPAESQPGLELCAILERSYASDAFVSNKYKSLSELPENAVVGTSSLRRASQLKAKYPIQTELLRGNVNTRLRKLDEDNYDAIILASAGLHRLGFDERIAEFIDTKEMIPSAGQGAVGVECRSDDQTIKDLLAKLNHQQTADIVRAEREFNSKVGGSCQVPAGCYIHYIDEKTFEIRAFISDPEGQEFFQEAYQAEGSPAGHGLAIAEKLLAAGGQKILVDLGLA